MAVLRLADWDCCLLPSDSPAILPVFLSANTRFRPDYAFPPLQPLFSSEKQPLEKKRLALCGKMSGVEVVKAEHTCAVFVICFQTAASEIHKWSLSERNSIRKK
ncbi:hypothetical protein Aduo_008788 [Ancylostoma duodenale]